VGWIETHEVTFEKGTLVLRWRLKEVMQERGISVGQLA
jgi:hypothetical protein